MNEKQVPESRTMAFSEPLTKRTGDQTGRVLFPGMTPSCVTARLHAQYSTQKFPCVSLLLKIVPGMGTMLQPYVRHVKPFMMSNLVSHA